MRALGLPAVLADMTLLSYRYIYEIGDDLEAMETAMGLRGFRARRPRARATISRPAPVTRSRWAACSSSLPGSSPRSSSDK
jgi:energy-coupling factor transporter transmembrane protein EcfT